MKLKQVCASATESLGQQWDLISSSVTDNWEQILSLQINSKCVISDSGTIQEDASILNFPAVTLRNSTEKKEAIEKGIAVISGYTSNAILDQINLTLNFKTKNFPEEYLFDDVSTNVTKLIIGLVSIQKKLIL